MPGLSEWVRGMFGSLMRVGLGPGNAGISRLGFRV